MHLLLRFPYIYLLKTNTTEKTLYSFWSAKFLEKDIARIVVALL